MQINKKNRWIWGFAVLIGVLLFLPSAFFIQTISGYHDFFSGISPGVLKQTKDSMIPQDLHKDLSFKPQLSFAEFHLQSPRAQNVYLIGNFNNWKPGTLKMIKNHSGEWSVFVPLPQGRYQYLFIVDGREIADPTNPLTQLRDGHSVSVKVVGK